ncbi:MAG TPA: cytochrome c biogenesis protein CcdA [Candidatus Limnocylindrales bacterium]|nr:cytochrome c biogenesis protein CcdA [Candidatus Limnocylindrales bacterium]
MTGDNLTILVALAAGVISFLSPCVLPLVPAYMGQLTAVAVADAARSEPVAAGATRGAPTGPSRWTALRHALAYVAGFGSVFTLLGVTATFAAAGLSPWMPVLRQVGGVLLVLLGLNLAGILRIPTFDRTWRPLDAGASASVATAIGTMSLANPGGTGGPGLGDRLGGRLVSSRGGWFASYGLGAIFAIGWTPCVGVILGGILGLASSSATVGQGAILLVAYTLGLGLPFLAIALAYDRAPGLLRPLQRHGRAVSVVGGLLVVAIGLAMIFDLLARLAILVPFNTQI